MAGFIDLLRQAALGAVNAAAQLPPSGPAPIGKAPASGGLSRAAHAMRPISVAPCRCDAHGRPIR